MLILARPKMQKYRAAERPLVGFVLRNLQVSILPRRPSPACRRARQSLRRARRDIAEARRRLVRPGTGRVAPIRDFRCDACVASLGQKLKEMPTAKRSLMVKGSGIFTPTSLLTRCGNSAPPPHTP